MDRLTEAATKSLVLRAAVLLHVWALNQQTQWPVPTCVRELAWDHWVAAAELQVLRVRELAWDHWVAAAELQVLRSVKALPQKMLHSKIHVLRAAGLYLPPL